MAPTTQFFLDLDVDASSASAAPAATPSFVNPPDTGYTGPNIPIWVAYIVAFLVLCAIIVLCCFARKTSFVWLKQVPELPKLKNTSATNALKKLKLLSGRVTSTIHLPPPMYTQMKEFRAAINPPSQDKPASLVTEKPVHSLPAPPPAHFRGPADSALPDSHYTLRVGRITRTNTLKNQRRTAQVFAKAPAVELAAWRR
ncbi:hypothetical protein C8R45DRAFT_537860 [Mycena sanguinolenta]|nr:hypothetical protein C8R45DRAFT_537860 [Mycena sanguinolenta]